MACLGAAASALAASSSPPKGGAIRLIVQPGNGQGSGKILVTGAIAGYGKSSKSKKSGHEFYGVVTLKQGTFKVNLTAVSQKANAANPPINAATCSAEISVTAPAPISDGTGLYAGVKGSVNLTETFALILPTVTTGAKKGTCNASENARPIAQMGTVYGTGSVSF